MEGINGSDLKGFTQYNRQRIAVAIGKHCDLQAFSPLAEIGDSEEKWVRRKNTSKNHILFRLLHKNTAQSFINLPHFYRMPPGAL